MYFIQFIWYLHTKKDVTKFDVDKLSNNDVHMCHYLRDELHFHTIKRKTNHYVVYFYK